MGNRETDERVKTLLERAATIPEFRENSDLKDLMSKITELISAEYATSHFVTSSGLTLTRSDTLDLRRFERINRPHIQPPRKLGDRFIVKRLIGRGGMGEVYEAEDLTLSHNVAIKCVRQGSAGIPNKDLLRSASLSRRIVHPNVCRTYDIYQDQEVGAFITMEMLDGETLASRLSRGPLTTTEALQVIRQLGSALSSAHTQGVVHCDLKPSNIMLVPDGADLRVVITDFGLARPVPPSWQARLSQSSLDTTTLLAGTPQYMAPEQFSGEPPTPATDIYALGLIMYEMVTGSRPYENANPFQIAINRTNETPPSPRLLVPDLDLRWERTILKCLSPQVGDRFHNMDEVVAALERHFTVWERVQTLLHSAFNRMGTSDKSGSALQAQASATVTCDWKIVLDGTIDQLDPSMQRNILQLLRQASGDSKLTILRIDRGSVVLVLRGTEEGYRIIENLFRSGKLRDVLGMELEHVSLLEKQSPQQRGQGENRTPEIAEIGACSVFVSYSHQDAKWRDRLSTHLASLQHQGLINTWHDRKISAGEYWEQVIDSHLESARIILFLVSPDFFASGYCSGIELKKALERHEKREARAIPVIIRPVDWKRTILGSLQALPADGKPISQWRNRDEALNVVSQELRAVVEKISA